MQNSHSGKRSLINSYVLSVLLHIILFLLFSTIIFFQPKQEEEKHPQYYTPAYTYTGAITPTFQQPTTASRSTEAPQKTQPQQKLHQTKLAANSTTGLPLKSVLSMSREVLKQDHLRSALSNSKQSEPILLIGDLNKPADPLIKLMARSLSAHFRYPQFEGNMGARGRVIVSLTLHPEGNYTDVQIIQSSDNRDFDAAALYAVNQAPTVVGADMFLSKPRFFVIGFIFD